VVPVSVFSNYTTINQSRFNTGHRKEDSIHISRSTGINTTGNTSIAGSPTVRVIPNAQAEVLPSDSAEKVLEYDALY
jgi:hypothetical protein